MDTGWVAAGDIQRRLSMLQNEVQRLNEENAFLRSNVAASSSTTCSHEVFSTQEESRLAELRDHADQLEVLKIRGLERKANLAKGTDAARAAANAEVARLKAKLQLMGEQQRALEVQHTSLVKQAESCTEEAEAKEAELREVTSMLQDMLAPFGGGADTTMGSAPRPASALILSLRARLATLVDAAQRTSDRAPHLAAELDSLESELASQKGDLHRQLPGSELCLVRISEEEAKAEKLEVEIQMMREWLSGPEPASAPTPQLASRDSLSKHLSMPSLKQQSRFTESLQATPQLSRNWLSPERQNISPWRGSSIVSPPPVTPMLEQGNLRDAALLDTKLHDEQVNPEPALVPHPLPKPFVTMQPQFATPPSSTADLLNAAPPSVATASLRARLQVLDDDFSRLQALRSKWRETFRGAAETTAEAGIRNGW